MAMSADRTAREKRVLMEQLGLKTGGEIAQFFVAHGLGQAYERPGRGASKPAKIATAMTEAEARGVEVELYDALEEMLYPGDGEGTKAGAGRFKRRVNAANQSA
jgi:hypothetical protein